MVAIFKEFQFVEVDGTATGYGDLVGWIKSIELSDILGQPYYHIRVYSGHIDTVYVAEKFVRETERSAIGNVLLSDSARYILFLIDSKFKQHDGKIFCSYKDAREYASNCISDKYCDKAVIGMFSLNTQIKEMFISMVETIGFTGDKKNVNQLELFK